MSDRKTADEWAKETFEDLRDKSCWVGSQIREEGIIKKALESYLQQETKELLEALERVRRFYPVDTQGWNIINQALTTFKERHQ